MIYLLRAALGFFDVWLAAYLGYHLLFDPSFTVLQPHAATIDAHGTVVWLAAYVVLHAIALLTPDR